MQDADTSIGQNADAGAEENTGLAPDSDKIQPENAVPNPVLEEAPPLCIECKHVIPAGALKCKECNSFQDWRRFLALSSTTLSLIVALLSVSGIVVPLLIETLSEKKAVLASKVVSIGDVNITVLVANSGTLDGYVGTVSVLADGSEHGSGTQLFSTVKASSSLPIELSLRENQRNFISAGKDCEVRIQLLDHALQDKTEQLKIACSAFR
ncbi:hypothetical protein [Parasedimentitalea marina]|nr:hypothetical protein [Parasedimentitalea marina]